MTTYQDFLSFKLTKVTPSGFDVDQLPSYLFDYQQFIVQLALKKGKFAIFANTGLGKTAMQLAWANEVFNHTHRPVWMDIDQSDVLQYRNARHEDDERHICPLQLTVIRRALQLWSNPGDLVLSPFAGIGSEGYVSLDMGRKFIGAELKKSYYEVAVKNLEYIENKPKQLSLVDLVA